MFSKFIFFMLVIFISCLKPSTSVVSCYHQSMNLILCVEDLVWLCTSCSRQPLFDLCMVWYSLMSMVLYFMILCTLSLCDSGQTVVFGDRRYAADLDSARIRITFAVCVPVLNAPLRSESPCDFHTSTNQLLPSTRSKQYVHWTTAVPGCSS